MFLPLLDFFFSSINYISFDFRKVCIFALVFNFISCLYHILFISCLILLDSYILIKSISLVYQDSLVSFNSHLLVIEKSIKAFYYLFLFFFPLFPIFSCTVSNLLEYIINNIFSITVFFISYVNFVFVIALKLNTLNTHHQPFWWNFPRLFFVNWIPFTT